MWGSCLFGAFFFALLAGAACEQAKTGPTGAACGPSCAGACSEAHWACLESCNFTAPCEAQCGPVLQACECFCGVDC